MDTNTKSRNPFVARVLRCGWMAFSIALGTAPLALMFTHLSTMQNASALLLSFFVLQFP